MPRGSIGIYSCINIEGLEILMDKNAEALKRLHDDIKREKKKEEITEEEWIRLLRTGGGAES